MANNAVSPILSALTEIRSGSPMIRAMSLQSFFARRQRELISEWAGLAFHQKALNSWGLVNAAYSALLSLAVAIYLIATRQHHDPALAALAITYAPPAALPSAAPPSAAPHPPPPPPSRHAGAVDTRS